MANSPCGGCPPCCSHCVFDQQAQTEGLSRMQVVTPAAEYGCIRGHGDVGIVNGKLGQKRSTGFHPVTPAGVQHLLNTGNQLAAYA